MNTANLDQLLEDCAKTIKKHIKDPQSRLDFESKIYAEGLKNAVLVIRNFLPENKKLKILDVGCGKGHISVMLASLGFSVYGIDVEETKGEQLAILEKKWQQSIWKDFENLYQSLDVKFQFYDGKKIPFPDESFDMIMAYAVIEHVAEPKNFLLETNRVLKKGGWFFIFRCPRKQAVIEYLAQVLKMPHHEKLIDEKEIVEELESNRFQKIHMEKSDLIPAFPPRGFQKLWNSGFKTLELADRVLLKTPLGYIAHHTNIICNKI